MITDAGIIHYIGLIPICAAIVCIRYSLKLALCLKPEMTCRGASSCGRCGLLYSLWAGSMVLSVVYVLAELKWMAQGNFFKIPSIDELAWCALETAWLLFLAWLCYRGLRCLRITIAPTLIADTYRTAKEG